MRGRSVCLLPKKEKENLIQQNANVPVHVLIRFTFSMFVGRCSKVLQEIVDSQIYLRSFLSSGPITQKLESLNENNFLASAPYVCMECEKTTAGFGILGPSESYQLLGPSKFFTGTCAIACL